MSIAVVDFTQLLKRHPDYPKLQKIDDEIQALYDACPRGVAGYRDRERRLKIAKSERDVLCKSMSDQIAQEAPQVAAHNNVGIIIRDPYYSHGLKDVTPDFKH